LTGFENGSEYGGHYGYACPDKKKGSVCHSNSMRLVAQHLGVTPTMLMNDKLTLLSDSVWL